MCAVLLFSKHWTRQKGWIEKKELSLCKWHVPDFHFFYQFTRPPYLIFIFHSLTNSSSCFRSFFFCPGRLRWSMDSLWLALSAIGLRVRWPIQQYLSDGQSRIPGTVPTQSYVPIPRRVAIAFPATFTRFHFSSTATSVSNFSNNLYIFYDIDLESIDNAPMLTDRRCNTDNIRVLINGRLHANVCGQDSLHLTTHGPDVIVEFT